MRHPKKSRRPTAGVTSAERVVAGRNTAEVARVRITEAGRRALKGTKR
jgi:hypothetical protein